MFLYELWEDIIQPITQPSHTFPIVINPFPNPIHLVPLGALIISTLIWSYFFVSSCGLGVSWGQKVSLMQFHLSLGSTILVLNRAWLLAKLKNLVPISLEYLIIYFSEFWGDWHKNIWRECIISPILEVSGHSLRFLS